MSEKNVEQLFVHRDKQEKVRLLYNMIVEAAESHDFARAESLHRELFATDSMALGAITGSAEVIEAAKSASIDPAYNEQRKDLIRTLSGEENNAVYFALKGGTLKARSVFIEQNNLNNRLFFIVRGSANIICRQGQTEVLLEQLGGGDIVGEDTFFGISICTTTVICQTPVVVKYLERDRLEAWQDSFPGLEEKLRLYCQNKSRLHQALAAKEVDRRQQPRYRLETVVTAQLQNLQGQDVGASFRGMLDDISPGGLCFYIKLSHKNTARMLLGRPVRLTVSMGKKDLILSGMIVSSKQHLRTDYTVHVRLNKSNDPHFADLLEDLRRSKGSHYSF